MYNTENACFLVVDMLTYSLTDILNETNMFRFLKHNKKNVLYAIIITMSFYLVAGPLVYYNYDFSEGLFSKGDVLGMVDEDPHQVAQEFLDYLVNQNFEHIESNTDLGDDVGFAKLNEIRSAEVGGEVRYESASVAIVKADFMFFVRQQNFEYPLTIVLILENVSGLWEVKDLEYTLERYNNALE